MEAQPTEAGKIGVQERHLAVSAVAQQVSQATGTLAMLGVITAIARTKTLAEFGLYGLVISFSTYLLIAQTSVEGSALKALSEARTDDDRDRAFSVALSLYCGAGLLAGLLIAGGGVAVLGLLNIPPRLHHQAVLGVVCVGAVMALGWPLKVFQDLLRGSQQFVLSASAEVAGYLAFAAGSAVLLLQGGPLWSLIMVGAALPSLMGAAALLIVFVKRLRFRFRVELLDAPAIRSFLGLSGYLFVLGIGDLVIYSLDRTVLSAFTSPATVGLYEGPVRAHNLIRQINGALALIVLPAAAAYVAAGDDARVRELLLRGTRYVAAAVVPVTVVLMVLARPILRAWLGARYQTADLAMVILTSYWLLASSTAVASPMLVAAGHIRTLVVYAGAMAIGNLVLSLILTPMIGLNGVVIGTAIPYALLSPAVLVIACRVFPVTIGDFARRVWLPVFSLAVPLVLAVEVIRVTLSPHGAPVILTVMMASLAAYWVFFYVIWLDPGEKLLIRDLIRRRVPVTS
jgi:O-antigen/teichoic acid export membrane protein